MFSVVHHGRFNSTLRMLKRASSNPFRAKLNSWGEKGVRALSEATPKDSGETARSWGYEIIESRSSTRIIWSNTNDAGSVPLAVLIQYGHGTRNGGYVEGTDYINPALLPVFDEIAKEAWADLIK